MIDKEARLQEILEALFFENVNVTLRAIISRSDGLFRHPTDLTRDKALERLVNRYRGEQETVRAAIDRTTKSSRGELQRVIALKNAEISSLNSKIDLLVSSHCAAIFAVREMGGFGKWKEFFDRKQEALAALSAMGALPAASVVSYEKPERDRE